MKIENIGSMDPVEPVKESHERCKYYDSEYGTCTKYHCGKKALKKLDVVCSHFMPARGD